MASKFKIINTTVKPQKLDKSGKDTRKVSEQIGHAVLFQQQVGDNVKSVVVMPGKFALSDTVDEALAEMESQGYIKIEEVKDMGSVLEAFRSQPKQAKAEPAAKKNAKAGQMGTSPDRGSEYEGAVNPDGTPNFVAVAPHR